MFGSFPSESWSVSTPSPLGLGRSRRCYRITRQVRVGRSWRAVGDRPRGRGRSVWRWPQRSPKPAIKLSPEEPGNNSPGHAEASIWPLKKEPVRHGCTTCSNPMSPRLMPAIHGGAHGSKMAIRVTLSHSHAAKTGIRGALGPQRRPRSSLVAAFGD